MTQRGHQEAFEFDQTRLGYQRYDGLPQNPAQNLAGTLNQCAFSGD